MPERYVLDAHAWVEYLRGSSPGRRVKEAIDEGEAFTSPITLAQVLEHASRSKADLSIVSKAITTMSDIVEVDSELAIIVAQKSAKSKKSAAFEAIYVEATAKKLGAHILSGDKSKTSARTISILKIK